MINFNRFFGALIAVALVGAVFAFDAKAGYDIQTMNIYEQTAETATSLDSNCYVPVFDTDADDDGTVDNLDTDSAGDADFVTCTDIMGLGSTFASDITISGDTTFTGGIIGLNEDVTAVNTLTTSECGKTTFLNSATEFDNILPAPTAGCKFKFIVKAAPSGAAYTISTASLANIFIGHVVTADVNTAAADGDSSTADDRITFADGVAVVGDTVTVESDGTSWYYLASAKVYNGITAAQVD